MAHEQQWYRNIEVKVENSCRNRNIRGKYDVFRFTFADRGNLIGLLLTHKKDDVKCQAKFIVEVSNLRTKT